MHKPLYYYAIILFGNLCYPESRLPKPPIQHKGMVFISGGEFTMGAQQDPDALDDEKPAHKVRLASFFIDETPVTNAQFKEFIAKTGYVTTAEKAPKLEDMRKQVPPGTGDPAPELLVAGSAVFRKPSKPARSWHDWWHWTPGADWRHPLGPGSSIMGKDAHPVVIYHGMMHKPMHNGRVNGYLLKRNGNMQHMAENKQNTSGVPKNFQQTGHKLIFGAEPFPP